MNSAENGIVSNMMPDEEIIYRARAGRLSFSRYLPNSTIIATNKRLFVLGPLRLFSKYRSYYYDRMEALDVKTGALSSKFIIKSAQGPSAIIFYNKVSVLTTFNIISNLIHSTKDPHYNDKKKAHALDTHYAVLNKGMIFEAPHKDNAVVLTNIVRTEQKQLKKEQGAIEPKKAVTPMAKIPKAAVAPVPPIKQKQKKPRSAARRVNLVIPEQPKIVAKPVLPPTVKMPDLDGSEQEMLIYLKPLQTVLTNRTAKISFNPDEDLEIFKQRKERPQKSGFAKFLDSFNILNPK